jgi:hypothetical protein
MIEIYQIKLGQYNHRRAPPKLFGLFNVSQVCQLTLLPFLFNIPRRVIVPRGFFYFTIPSKIQESSYQGGLLGNSQKKHFLTGRKPALKAGTQINLLQLIGGTE